MYINQVILIKDLGTRNQNETSKHKVRYGIYECPVCGIHFETATTSVNMRKSSRCKNCANKANSTKHGYVKTRLYTIWTNMLQRVSNEKTKTFQNYGARGIAVCDEWKDFIAFRDWALANGYSENLTIDRINNDGNYEPNNCRWTNILVQARNTRKLRADNTTGYRGVVKRTLKDGSYSFVAQINVNSKKIGIGTFKCRLAAAYAYDDYVAKNNLEHTKNFEN